MAKLSGLRLNREAIKKGRWFSTEEEFGADWRLLIANFRTPGFAEAFAKATREAGVSDESDADNEDVIEAVAPLVAEYLLIGWDKLQDDDGEPIPYTYERAVEILTDPDMSHVVTFVINRARRVAEYLQRKSANALGN